MTIKRNIFANYVGRAYSIAATYIFVPFYVQILGFEAYGVIAIYTVLLTLAGVADVGLSAAFSREAASCSDIRKLFSLMTTIERVIVACISILSLLIFMGAPFIAAHWLDLEGKIEQSSVLWAVRIMALMLIPQMCIVLYSAGLIGLQKQVAANIIQSLFVTARSGFVVILIYWQPDLHVFFGWQLIITLLTAVIIRCILAQAMGHASWELGEFKTKLLRSNLSFAGGMMWISIVSSINTQADKLIISNLFSITDLGYYSLASVLSQLPIALASPIAVAFYPYITKHVANKNKAQEELAYITYGQWISFMGSLGAFTITFYSPQILTIWLQEPNVPSVISEITSILTVGSLFLCLAIPSYYLGLANGNSYLIALLATGTLIFSIPLIITAAIMFGLKGAAYPWIFLNVVNLVLLTVFVAWRSVGERITDCLFRVLALPIIAALLPILSGRLLADSLNVSPIIECAIAAASASIAVLGFVSLLRFKFVDL